PARGQTAALPLAARSSRDSWRTPPGRQPVKLLFVACGRFLPGVVENLNRTGRRRWASRRNKGGRTGHRPAGESGMTKTKGEQFAGVTVALITPLRSGEVDYAALRKL